MKVELVSYTPDALNLLLRTKGTRLAHGEDPAAWPEERKLEHLRYMRDTIKSSWEFVDYTFRIEGVTRAFTHQLVRTRTGSYAQEAQRVVDVRNYPVVRPEASLAKANAMAVWMEAEEHARRAYAQMIDAGVPVQDARGILPTAITTSIMAKYSLRALSEMARLRLCTRTQGEYQDVFRAMRAAVLVVHPWAEEFIQVECVASGSCAFPRYGREGCPVYFPELDREQVKATAHRRFWSAERFEAVPVVKDGKTM